MLGYPLKLLLNAIERVHGHEAVVQTLVEAGLPADRVYRLNEPYADSEAQSLSAAASKRITLEDIAEAFFEDTLVRFPTWFEMCKTSREFLEMQPRDSQHFRASGCSGRRSETLCGISSALRNSTTNLSFTIALRIVCATCTKPSRSSFSSTIKIRQR